MNIIRLSIFYFLELLSLSIIIRAILSWVIRDYRNPVMQFLFTFTEPILSPIRSVLSALGIGGMVDFSSLVALLLFQFIRMLL